MIALFHRLLAAHNHYQAQHQHRMNQMRLAGVRRELAGLEEMHKELLYAEIDAQFDLAESSERVKQLGLAHQEAQWASSVKP
ncbi:hypothetical protein [Janthinobacterium sp. LB2P10]|uniref:hypothetical protein n=1 Tax=Janthinobacterium sp. LB2P10 TaxID=3424194 RepID=UPI003F20F5D3